MLRRRRKNVFNSVFVLANNIEIVLLVMDEAKQETLGFSVFSDRHLFHMFDKAVVVGRRRSCRYPVRYS